MRSAKPLSGDDPCARHTDNRVAAWVPPRARVDTTGKKRHLSRFATEGRNQIDLPLPLVVLHPKCNLAAVVRDADNSVTTGEHASARVRQPPL